MYLDTTFTIISVAVPNFQRVLKNVVFRKNMMFVCFVYKIERYLKKRKKRKKIKKLVKNNMLTSSMGRNRSV